MKKKKRFITAALAAVVAFSMMLIPSFTMYAVTSKTSQQASQKNIVLQLKNHNDSDLISASSKGRLKIAKVNEANTKREPIKIKVTIPTIVGVKSGAVKRVSTSSVSADKESGMTVGVSHVRRVSSHTYKCNTILTIKFDGSQDAALKKALARKGKLTSEEKPVSDHDVTWTQSISDSTISYTILKGIQKKSGIRYVSKSSMRAAIEAELDYDHLTVTETKLDGSPLKDSVLESVKYYPKAHRLMVKNTRVENPTVKVKWIGYGYKEKDGSGGSLPVQSVDCKLFKDNSSSVQTVTVSKPDWLADINIDKISEAPDNLTETISEKNNNDFENRVISYKVNESDLVNSFVVFNARLGKARVMTNYVGFIGTHPTGIGAHLTGEGNSKSFTLPSENGGYTELTGLSMYHLDALQGSDVDVEKYIGIDFPDQASGGEKDKIIKNVCTLKQYNVQVNESPYYTTSVTNVAVPDTDSNSEQSSEQTDDSVQPQSMSVKGDQTAESTSAEDAPEYDYVVTVMPTDRSITVTKEWGEDTKPHSVTVHLMRNGYYTGQTVTLNAANGYTASFNGLQKYDYSSPTTDGGYQEYQYTVEETEKDSDQMSVTTTGSMGQGYTITNDSIRRSINVTKKWGSGTTPQEVTVHLLRNGADTGKTIKLNEENSYKASFDQLPKYNYEKCSENGKYEEYQYTVEEENNSKWRVSITGSMDEGFTITNYRLESDGTNKPDVTDKPDKTDQSDQISQTDQLTELGKTDYSKSPDRSDDRSQWQSERNETVKKTADTVSSSPKSGDSRNAGLWALVMIGAASAVGVLYFKKKRS